MRRVTLIWLALLSAASAFALQPPRRGELAALRASGDLGERVTLAVRLGNHRLELAAPGVKVAGAGGLPTTGTVRVLALLVDFPDAPHIISAAVIDGFLFGAGDLGLFPKDSLRQFYLRSSFGKLDIRGSTLGWYTAANPRAHYTNRAGLLLQEVLAHFDAQGHDFSSYDNDGDGEIDSINVFWAGEVGEWATFWWGTTRRFLSEGGDSEFRVDGKAPGKLTWQPEDESPACVIHETGHMLGLPDYYDYDGEVGPKGGIGNMDVMAGDRGDHNGYSKWVLGWITPQRVTAAQATALTLPAAATSAAGTVVIGAADASPNGEYFVVQNRARVGNDVNMPGDGLLVFHVDARVGCDGVTPMLDNSVTEHKLLRLVEADGADDIERWHPGDANDYFRGGGTAAFGPFTTPASDRNDGRTSGVLVDTISAPGQVMTASARVLPLAPAGTPVVRAPVAGSATAGMMPRIAWDAVPGAGGYQVELHSGPNRLHRASVAAGEHEHTVPAGVITCEGAYAVWVRALGNGSSVGAGPFRRSYFSTRPCGGARWVGRTFANLCCGVNLDHPGLAYDPGGEVTVLFGGGGSNATFEYDGESWKAYTPNPAPSPRYYPVLVPDPGGGGVLLFGGLAYPDFKGLSDTWRYRPASHTWQQLAPAVSPPINWTWESAADTGRGVAVLVSASGTWEWDGVTWRQAVPAAGTPQVYLHAVAHDERRGRTVLFGGKKSGDGTLSDDTWEYDGAVWELVAQGTRPPARVDHALVFHQTTGVVLTFGGRSASAPLSDVLAWDGSGWSEVTPCDSLGPQRWTDFAVYDARREVMVTLGWGGELAVWELELRDPKPAHRVRRHLGGR